MAALFCIPTNSYEDFNFSISSPTLVIIFFILALGGSVIPQCGFDLHFFWQLMILTSHMFIGHICIFFGELSI